MSYDPYWNNVAFLMQPNGPVGSTAFVDVKGHAISAGGNARHENAPAGLFGGTCAYFDGSGDYLQAYDASPFLSFDTPYTVEFFFNCDSQYNALASFYSQAVNQLGTWSVGVQNGGTAQIDIVGGGSTGGSSLNSNTWKYMAISCEGVRVRVYAGAVSGGTASIVMDFYRNNVSGCNWLTIGGGRYYSERWLRGYIGPFRMTKGVGRYTANSIAIPTEPFPAAGPLYVGGGVVDAAGNLAVSRPIYVYQRSTGALLGSASTTAAGTFQIGLPLTAPEDVFVVCLDDAAGDVLPALIHDRVTPSSLV